MPMRFSNGRINVLTLACERPGGFTTRELGWVHEALPILSRLLEVHALHRTARSLLDTYLGAHTGQRVLNGLVKRGAGEDIPAGIWYSDLRGSTAFAATLPRAEYHALPHRHFAGVAGAALAPRGEGMQSTADAAAHLLP